MFKKHIKFQDQANSWEDAVEEERTNNKELAVTVEKFLDTVKESRKEYSRKLGRRLITKEVFKNSLHARYSSTWWDEYLKWRHRKWRTIWQQFAMITKFVPTPGQIHRRLEALKRAEKNRGQGFERKPSFLDRKIDDYIKRELVINKGAVPSAQKLGNAGEFTKKTQSMVKSPSTVKEGTKVDTIRKVQPKAPSTVKEGTKVDTIRKVQPKALSTVKEGTKVDTIRKVQPKAPSTVNDNIKINVINDLPSIITLTTNEYVYKFEKKVDHLNKKYFKKPLPVQSNENKEIFKETSDNSNPTKEIPLGNYNQRPTHFKKPLPGQNSENGNKETFKEIAESSVATKEAPLGGNYKKKPKKYFKKPLPVQNSRYENKQGYDIIKNATNKTN